jgi:hypothetical protein
MTDKQAARAAQGGFEEIQLQDWADQPGRLNVPIAQPVYQAGNMGYSPQRCFAPYPGVQAQSSLHYLTVIVLKKDKRLLKWLSIADMLSILLFLFDLRFAPFLILLPFPLFGLFGSLKLSRSLGVAYIVWLSLLLLIRLLLLMMTQSNVFAMIDFLLITFDLCVFLIAYRFVFVLDKLSPEDIIDIKNGTFGQRSSPQNADAQNQPQFQPQFQAQFQPQFQPQSSLNSSSRLTSNNSSQLFSSL